MKKRVVITGLGAVTPVGIGVESFWQSLLAGKSGIDRITRFDPSDYTTQIAGEVKDFDPAQFIDKKEAKRMDRCTQFAVAATKMAFEDAGIDFEQEDRNRMGTVIGTGIGGMDALHDQYKTLFDKGPGRISPFFVPMMIANMPAGQTSITFGLQGPCTCVVTACATGANAIGDAFKIIQRGDADVMVAGGTESPINRLSIAGFAACRALSTDFNEDPTRASRPYDKDRDGFVMGEGAGAVVLEEYEDARVRGAKIYAEVIGYGMSGDAYHITSPAEDGDGAYRCMAAAIKRAGISPSEIDYVNAHGTSTPLGDEIELRAVERLMGDAAANLVMSSTKSSIGHLLGAAGAVEAIFSMLAMRDQIVPPTLNLDNPSVETRIDLVPHRAKKKKLDIVVSNSFGFGGTNASLVLRRVD